MHANCFNRIPLTVVLFLAETTVSSCHPYKQILHAYPHACSTPQVYSTFHSRAYRRLACHPYQPCLILDNIPPSTWVVSNVLQI